MNEFIQLSNQNNRNINLEIIKSFSVLILNVKSPQTLYFFFSNNFINQIISNNYEKYDDDFIFYYINFLKSLTMKIDFTTVQFFFNNKYSTCSLILSALRYYNYPDPMIKNTVRSVMLNFLKRKFICITSFSWI